MSSVLDFGGIGFEDDMSEPGGTFGMTVLGEYTGANLVRGGEPDHARDHAPGAYAGDTMGEG